MRRTAGLCARVLCAGLLGAGCAVPIDESIEQEPVNTCTADPDCALGATCTQGRCVATSYDLGGLILGVHPDVDAIYGGGSTFLIDPAAGGVQLVSKGLDDTPFLTRLDLALPALVAVQGTIQPDPVTLKNSPTCKLPSGTLPANLTFFRIPELVGLPFDVAYASTTTQAGSNVFDVSLPAGPADRYDVYVEPTPVAGCPPFAPYLVPDQSFAAGSGGAPDAVNWLLPPLGLLSGTIAGIDDVTKWQVDLVEPSRGLPISTGSTLIAGGTPDAPVATVNAYISNVATGLPPILRLRPLVTDTNDASPYRPTVYWKLAEPVTQGSAMVAFDITDLAVQAVKVEGQILGADGVKGFAAGLTVQSTSLTGSNAGNAAFSIDLSTDEPVGHFIVNLPPGTYTMRAVPVADNGLSVTDFPLTVPLSDPPVSCVCAQTYPLQTRPTIAGTLTTPAGPPLVAATVRVTPSQVATPTYLAATHALGSLPARAESTTTDGFGRFTFVVDPGTSDFTVQTDPSTNLPWLVRPQISPALETAPSALVLSSPAFLGGLLTTPLGMPMTSAQIDAWFPVRNPSDPSAPPIYVVRIATTTTDANGAYTLVLPSSVSN